MSFDPAEMLRHPLVPLLWVGVVHLAAHAVGLPLLSRILGARGLMAVGQEAFQAQMLGLSVLANGALLMGFLGLLEPWLVVAVTTVLAVLGLRRLMGAGRAALGSIRQERVPLRLLPAAAAWCFYLSYLPYALSPVLHHDDSTYHLRLPWLYLTQAGIAEQPTLIYANMPHLVEVLYTLPMAIGDFTAPKVLMYSVVGWILVGLWSFARPRGGAVVAGLVLLVFLSGKNLQWQLGLAYIEPLLAGWLLAAVLALLAWRRSGRTRWLFLVGLHLGAAAASKYTTWYYVALVGSLLLVLAVRRAGLRRGLVQTLRAGSLVFLLVAPWLTKNLLVTGNPVYPNLPGLFPSAHWSATQQGQLYRTVASAGGLEKTIADRLAIPWHLTLGDDYYRTPSFSIALMVLLLLASLVTWRRRGEMIWISTVAWGGFLLWATGVTLGRYLVAWLGVLTLPAAYVLGAIPPRRTLLAAATLALVAVGGYQLAAQRYPWQPPWVSLTPGRAALLPHNHNWELVPILTELVPAEGTVLALWENRLFFLPRKAQVDGSFQAPSGLGRLRAHDSPKAFARELRDQGVTHVVVHVPNLRRYFGEAWEGVVLDEETYPEAQRNRDRVLLDRFLSTHLEPLRIVGPHAILGWRTASEDSER